MNEKWQEIQQTRLKSIVKRLFGKIEDEINKDICQKFVFTELRAGKILMNQGDPGDSMYLLISGRLRVYVTGETGIQETVGSIMPGEAVGEMSLMTGDPRSASIIAVRDATLARLIRSDFENIIADHPELIMNITRMIIERLKRMNTKRKAHIKQNTITVIDAGNSTSSAEFSKQLSTALSSIKKVHSVNWEEAERELKVNKVFSQMDSDWVESHELSSWLDEKESNCESLILTGSSKYPKWTKTCIRQADILLLVADSQNSKEISALEKEIFDSGQEEITSVKFLIIRHEKDIAPRETKKWLQDRPVSDHFHLRYQNHDDLKRLSRILMGTSNGLVLSGGGAKGIAHIGIFKALHEYGINIDMIGGTSIGAIIGGFIGLGLAPGDIIDVTRDMFLANPTPITDLSVIPVFGLLRGRKLEGMLRTCFGHLDIEDLPINFFCVSSNLTTSNMEVHESGDLMTAIRASMSLPGIFPPVLLNGNVLVDGGIVNNLPVDIMADKGVGKIIAVSLFIEEENPLDIDVLPSISNVLSNRFFRFKRPKYNLPTLMNTIVKSTTINSDFREKELLQGTDLLFNPDVSKFGLTNWKEFDQLVSKGYDHARKVLDELPENHALK